MTILRNSRTRITASGALGGICYPKTSGVRHIYPRHNGAEKRLNSYRVYPFTAYLELEDFKDSVITGHFEPGTYRVNPYHVTKSYAQFEPCTYPKGVPDNEVDRYSGLEPAVYQGEYPLWWIRDSYNGWWGFVKGTSWQTEMYKLAMTTTVGGNRPSFEQLVLQKAYGKVSAADISLGEQIGELRETIKMLREPLSALKKFFMDDRSRNFRLFMALMDQTTNPRKSKREIAKLLGRTGTASADTIASTWLELRYGLRPLCMLLLDVVERVYRKQKAVFDPNVIRSARSKLVFGPYKTGYKYRRLYSENVAVACDLVVEDKLTVNASVSYKQKFDQSFLDSLGLTPRFLPETVWELTRLTFVWDWLLSIGPWLATLRLQPDYQVLGNTVGCKTERLITNGPPRIQSHYGKDEKLMEDAYHPDTDYYYRHDYERKVNIPLSYTPHFTWGRTLDLYKVIDSLSLIWQFIANLKRN